MSVMPWDSVKAIGNNNYEQLAKWNPQIDTNHIAIQTRDKFTVKYMPKILGTTVMNNLENETPRLTLNIYMQYNLVFC